jgi:hypothetical protein
MGAAFAPVAGAMAAEYLATAGLARPARGINPAGMAAWLAGLAVGLVPTVADSAGLMPWWKLQPAALRHSRSPSPCTGRWRDSDSNPPHGPLAGRRPIPP